jgi:hypothetical protein
MLTSGALPRGDLGTYLTLMRMSSMVRSEMMHPDVRLTAVNIVSGENPRDGAAFAVAIRQWVEAHTQFMPDPDGTEMLHGPKWQVQQVLTHGLVYVDCDDVAMLCAALGKAVGLRARFVVVAFQSPNAPFAHVWTELAPANSEHWIECDITRPAQGLAGLPIARWRTFGV